MIAAPTQKTLLVIVGPTAVGKTATAIELAQYFNAEVISADSRQFYREMSIGTAKPNKEELAATKHHFVNSHSIAEPFNAGDFEKEGIKKLEELFDEHNVAVLAGGSGLYSKAICEGFDDLPQVDAAIREELNRDYAEKGITYLSEQLKAIDPTYYQKVDTKNPQRIIRAIEVYRATGKPISSYRAATYKPRNFNIIKIGLNLPRPQLYSRINERVDLMIADGLVEEVKSLLRYRYTNALNTVGYKELFDYLDGKIGLDAAIDQIKQNTRNFAKRQLTWFNKDKSINWFEPGDLKNIIRHVGLSKA